MEDSIHRLKLNKHQNGIDLINITLEKYIIIMIPNDVFFFIIDLIYIYHIIFDPFAN